MLSVFFTNRDKLTTRTKKKTTIFLGRREYILIVGQFLPFVLPFRCGRAERSRALTVARPHTALPRRLHRVKSPITASPVSSRLSLTVWSIGQVCSSSACIGADQGS